MYTTVTLSYIQQVFIHRAVLTYECSFESKAIEALIEIDYECIIAARSGPRFASCRFLLLAGYENLTAPNAIMQS